MAHVMCAEAPVGFNLNTTIVRLKRPDKIQVDRDLRRRRNVRDLHASLAGLLIPFPFIHSACAMCSAAVRALHRRIQFFVR